MAVVLNLLFNHFRAGTPERQCADARGGDRYIGPEVLEALEEGDYVLDRKLVDGAGSEVPIRFNGPDLKRAEHRNWPPPATTAVTITQDAT